MCGWDWKWMSNICCQFLVKAYKQAVIQIWLCFRINENYELLKSRRQMILRSKEGLELDVKEQTALNRAHVANMNSLKPEIKRLHKLRDTYKKWVHSVVFCCKHFLTGLLPWGILLLIVEATHYMIQSILCICWNLMLVLFLLSWKKQELFVSCSIGNIWKISLCQSEKDAVI